VAENQCVRARWQAGCRVDGIEIGKDLAVGEVDTGLNLDLEIYSIVGKRQVRFKKLGVWRNWDECVP
jgi:hypothetical protein